MSPKLIPLMMISLAACTTAPDATLKQGTLAGDQVIATDSRLRVINSPEISDASIPGEVDPRYITCTEPSPDVAAVIVHSLGSKLDILGHGSASISAEHVEKLLKLGERTATIQLLRDKMYQTCLAYANGAISGTTYSIIMNRLDDTIVTLLMSETIGSAFDRALASTDGHVSTLSYSLLDIAPEVSRELEVILGIDMKFLNENEDSAEHGADDVLSSGNEEGDDEGAGIIGKYDKEAKVKPDLLQRLIEGATPQLTSPEVLADMQAEFLLHEVSSSIITASLVSQQFLQKNQLVGVFSIR